MPEGPEIRRAADRIERALRPFEVSAVFFAFEHLKPYAELLRGCRVKHVETRGKAMLIHHDNRISIYCHNQLYGRWFVRKAHDYPKTNRQLRLAIHNQQHSAMLYSASDIQVLTPQQVAGHPFLAALGPDVLSAEIGCVLERLQSARFRRRRLGSLLLDQRCLAGIGNYLRSEILFVAGLHPRLRPIDCSTEELTDLANAAHTVSFQSYRHDGITIDLSKAQMLKRQGQTRTQYRHWVFARPGQPCRVCDLRIEQDLAAGRRIFFCPACQPGPATRPRRIAG